MKHKTPVVTSVAGPVGKLNAVWMGDGGIPVLFIHDNAGDHTHWSEAQQSFSSRTVSFDLRGLGDSEGARGPFGVEASVEDVAAVADALLPGERFVLVGHGFGGAVAGAFAAYFPERLAGLVYVDAPGDLRSTPAADRDAFLANFSVQKYGTFHEHWLMAQLNDAKPATKTLVTKTLRTSRRDPVAANVESLYSYDPGEAFNAFKGPTYSFAATAGPTTLVGQRPELPRSIAPHTSHWLMLDAPQWFHTELQKFLGDCRHTA